MAKRPHQSLNSEEAKIMCHNITKLSPDEYMHNHI